ncbi:MAG: UDP-N-acetylglucosamine 2-epimerase (non-hydrolyzing) [Candidatus Norongarragalinales archaeon]
MAFKVLNVVGARPNFMKIAPIMREMQKRQSFFNPVLVHTGQHYDFEMNKVFFEQLGIPEPDHFLGVGSASHAAQTANIMLGFEKVLLEEKPDLVLVVGDVNSTLACALVAVKERHAVAHVEAGLRSNDWRMPEEINRILTDKMSKFLFTTSKDADENLKNEGITEGIHFVGNTMIDSLRIFERQAEKNESEKKFGLEKGEFALVTLHRPENVDDAKSLGKVVKMVSTASSFTKIVFPVHPRTKSKLEQTGLNEKLSEKGVVLAEPLGYLEFLNLEAKAKFVLTDSGGIQEETTVLGVPCFTARRSTERPVTVSEGTNTIVGLDAKLLKSELEKLYAGRGKKGRIPEKWDGKAAERICGVLQKGL